MPVTSNPYAPPESETLTDVALPVDTEFLFNRKCLAVSSSVELPRLCVVRGELVPREFQRRSVLFWIPFLIRMPIIVSGVVLSLAAAAFAGHVLQVQVVGGEVFPAQSLWPQVQEMQGFAFVAVFFLGLVTLSFVFGRSIQVVWSICQAEIQRYRWRQTAWTFVWGSMGTMLAFMGWISNGAAVGYVPFCIGFALISGFRALRGPRPLVITGRFNCLFLVTGLSKVFLERVEELVKRKSM